MTYLLLLSIALLLGLPAGLSRLNRMMKTNQVLSDIVLCYGLGILLGNTDIYWLYSWSDSSSWQASAEAFSASSRDMAKIMAFAAVLLAMPMLLMINDLRDWLRYSGSITVVFFGAILASALGPILVACCYQQAGADLPELATASGMLCGVYTGGTANMVAVSKALSAKDELFIMLNATDTFCSGLYFFFLLALGQPFFGLMLKAFKNEEQPNELAKDLNKAAPSAQLPPSGSWSQFKSLLMALLVAIIILLLAALPALWAAGPRQNLNEPVLLFALTSFAIGASFIKPIRQLKVAFHFAQYLLLIFALAAGYMADFSAMVNEGGQYLFFNTMVLLMIILLHFIFSLFLSADRDSFIISSTATILGPPFIAQICTALKNKSLLPIGIALSLLGLAFANYSGILVYWVIQHFFH